MKFHIIRNNEKIEDIMFLYNLTKDELIECNKHIRVWDKLIPGTKLKVPTISEAIEQDVSQMEPFIEDYYPKLKYNEKQTNQEKSFEKEEDLFVQEVNEEIIVDNEEENSKIIKEGIVQEDNKSEEEKKKEIMKEVAKYQTLQNPYRYTYQNPYNQYYKYTNYPMYYYYNGYYRKK